MQFRNTSKNSAQLGISSAGAVFTVIAFLSGLCFTLPDALCGILKDGGDAQLCTRPMIASRNNVNAEQSSSRLKVFVPQSVNEEVLQSDHRR